MKSRYFSPARPCLGSLLSVLLLLTLAACGTETTPAPAAAKPNPTGGSSGMVSSTGTGDYTSGKFNLPGMVLTTIDPGVGSVLKGLLSAGATAPDMVLQIYASDSETPVLGENADTALTKAGYVFHDVRNGTASKMIVNGNEGAGAYTKAGAPDVVLYARESSALTGGGTPPGVDASKYQNLVSQIQGKKSVLIVLSGTNLFQGLSNTNSTLPPPTQS